MNQRVWCHSYVSVCSSTKRPWTQRREEELTYFSSHVFKFFLEYHQIFLLSLMSSVKIFHCFTPQTEMFMLFRVVWAIGCLKLHLPLRSYSPSLSLNVLWKLPGCKLWFALYRMCAVLNSTKSLNVSERDFKNSALVCSWYPTLFSILIALFCMMHIDCRVFLEVFPHTSTQYVVEREDNIVSAMIYSSVCALFCILSPQSGLTWTWHTWDVVSS